MGNFKNRLTATGPRSCLAHKSLTSTWVEKRAPLALTLHLPCTYPALHREGGGHGTVSHAGAKKGGPAALTLHPAYLPCTCPTGLLRGGGHGTVSHQGAKKGGPAALTLHLPCTYPALRGGTGRRSPRRGWERGEFVPRWVPVRPRRMGGGQTRSVTKARVETNAARRPSPPAPHRSYPAPAPPKEDFSLRPRSNSLAPPQGPPTTFVAEPGRLVGKSRRRRAYPQQIVTTRLLYCLQDPFAQLSRLQRI